MKKHSFTFKILSVLIAAIVSIIGVRTDVFAVNVSTLSYTCQRALCSQKMTCIGPVLPGDTIPSSDPINGGKTYEEFWKEVRSDIDTEDGHLYIVFCPKATKSTAQAVLGHSYTYYLYKHNFAISYKELSNDVTEGSTTYTTDKYHIRMYDCNSYANNFWIISQSSGGQNAAFDNDMLYEVIEDIGANGCGLHKEEYSVHGWIYGSWIKSSETKHTRTIKCSLCGYTKQETSSHTFVNSSLTSLDDTQHYYTKTCSGCGYSEQIKSNHSLTKTYNTLDSNQHTVKLNCSDCSYENTSTENHIWEYSDYTKNQDGTHTYTKTCSKCGYSETVTENHTYKRTPETGYTYFDTTAHSFINTCTVCGYTSITYKRHELETAYSVYSSEQHSINKTCECGYALDTEYGDHHDDDGDCYCDDCGYLMTMFSVTVPSTMSVVMDKDGKVYTASNAEITNNSTADVKVSSVNISGQNGWSIVDYNTNMANEKVDSKKIGLKLNNAETNSDGSIEVNGDWNIPVSGSLSLPYDAVVSATSSPIENQKVMEIVFVVDWSDA